MRKSKLLLSFVLTACVAASGELRAQQVGDPDFKPRIEKPAYTESRGPVVGLDEAHFNFHTAEGRYKPFAELLRRDGYVVKPFTSKFSRESLREIRILVIANSLAERNSKDDWSLPTPSAFTDEEVAAVRDWVKGGGALLLIADHMPMPGAVEKLAAAFGLRWNNGFAVEPNAASGTMIFKRADGTLIDHAITNGRTKAERVESVATFTGSAFQADKDAKPLLVFGDKVISLMPEVAWQFKDETPRVPVKGWFQGAVLRFGKGRVAAFGEAAMFSAQLAGPNKQPMGMNAPVAAQNHQLLLNVLHWLSGLLKD
ncbi:MAG TPA: DUF4350 domain-containing protein [Pyrinomonadaceae bacterium]|jgi:hypothetical protein